MRGRRTGAALAGAIALAITTAGSAGTAHAAGPGETILASGLPMPAGAIAGGVSGEQVASVDRVATSDDGRWVAFVSTADALSPDVHPDVVGVFRADRQTGAVELVSRATGPAGATAAAHGREPAISDDGTRVAWITAAGLDAADLDGATDVYVRDLATATTTLATPGTALPVVDVDLSGNGQWVAFATGERLVLGDNNGAVDVYRRQVGGPAAQLVSAQSGGGVAANGDSAQPSISDDGAWVAFASAARDLVPGFADANGAFTDVYARDVATRVTHLVSSDAGNAARGANNGSSQPDLAGAPPSGAATAVSIAYASGATTLDPADPDPALSVYRHRDLSQPRSTLASRATGPDGATAARTASAPTISDDGDRIAFASAAADLGGLIEGPGSQGAFVRDLGAATTTFLSAGSSYAAEPSIAGDGGAVAWFTGEGVTPDTEADLSGILARSYGPGLGAVQHVSRPPGDAPYLLPAAEVDSDEAQGRTISADGRFVAFVAWSRRLPGGGAGTEHVYRRDLATGAVELVSRATGADGAAATDGSSAPTISADGGRVAFTSWARLDPADGDALADVYVRDLAAGTTTLASRADGTGGADADEGANSPVISAEGRHVVFVSEAPSLGVPDGVRHLWLRDLAAGTTRLVDRANGPAGVPASENAGSPSLSADGRLVAWATAAGLDPADPAPGSGDAYVRDVVAGTTTLVSRRSGADGAKAAGYSYEPVLADDGSMIVFATEDDAVAPEGGPWNGSVQIVARSLVTHQNALVSRAPGGEAANGAAWSPEPSANGAVVAFVSDATNLLPGRGGADRPAAFARATATGAISGPPALGLAGNQPIDGVDAVSVSADGQCLAFAGRGHAPHTGAAGDVRALWVHVLPGGTCPKPLPQDRGREPESTDPPRAGARAPRITGASLLRRRFRVGRARTAVAAARRRAARGGRGRRRRPAPVGTAFRFALSERADVTISITRRAAGKRVGRGCRRPSRKLRARRACVRWVAVRPALARRGLAAGRRSVAFSGRIGRRALAPGTYRAAIGARNEAGRARPATLTFTIARR